jgi:uncharacterized protein (TIGR00730 family)
MNMTGNQGTDVAERTQASGRADLLARIAALQEELNHLGEVGDDQLEPTLQLLETATSAANLQARDLAFLAKSTAELAGSFSALPTGNKGIWFCGSARFPETSPQYKAVTAMAFNLAVRTYGEVPFPQGGGPGAMGATAWGAVSGGAKAPAFTISRLALDEKPNAHSHPIVAHELFFPRKVRLLKAAGLLAFVPGGYGTMDELFEAMTMIQCGKASDRPIYLVGSRYWHGIVVWLHKTMLKHGYISGRSEERKRGDLELLTLVDIHKGRVSSETRPFGQESTRLIGLDDFVDESVTYMQHRQYVTYDETKETAARKRLEKFQWPSMPADW